MAVLNGRAGRLTAPNGGSRHLGQFPKCAKVIGDIRDQSMCGCCWAFGTAEAASDRLCISTGGKTQIPLSAQDLCFNSNPSGPSRRFSASGPVYAHS